MKIRRLVFLLCLGVFIVASLAFLMPQTVHAQCGLPGIPPCPPKKKTPTSPPPTRTSTPTPTATFEGGGKLIATATWEGGGKLVITATSQGGGQLNQGGGKQSGMLILVLLIGVLTGGLFIIVRGIRPPNPNKPPNPSKKE